MANSSREKILSQIRLALLPQDGEKHLDDCVRLEDIPREYTRSRDSTQHQLVCQLKDRLHDYDAQVLSIYRREVTTAIASMLTARGLQTLLVPEGFPAAILPSGFKYVADHGLTLVEMDGCDGVITEATLAIAETGTIVLQNVPGQGRRAASLIPDYHLCIVEASRIHATVPEAIAALAETSKLPTTFISGPSATADIEMTRIKGVHGPRFLDVILILDETHQHQGATQ